MWTKACRTAIVSMLLMAHLAQTAPDNGLATIEGKVVVDGQPLQGLCPKFRWGAIFGF